MPASDFNLTVRSVRFPKALAQRTDLGDFLAPDGKKKRRNANPIFSVFSKVGGKPWSAREATGIWRDFVAIDLRDPKQILQWVKRWGFLFAALDATLQEHTTEWWALQASLRRIEAAWTPPDKDGNSIISDTKKWVAAAENFDRDLYARRLLDGAVTTRMVIGKDGPERLHEAQSLAGFLIGSAIAGLQNRTPMRQCSYGACGGWFFRARSDAKYCCDSHRTQAFMKQRAAAAA